MDDLEKYRPTRVSDLIVNNKILEQITQWLRSWENGVPAKRAIILHGPPGTGKTTTAYAIAGEMGLPVVEMNASNERSSDSMKRVALMASLYRDLSTYDENVKREYDHIILIDEADNIFESRNSRVGGDTGGLTELARIIKSSRSPIIITMNEFYDFRRKSAGKDIVANSVVIEFRQFQRVRDTDYKSFKLSLLQRIRYIAEKEGLQFDPSVVERAIEVNRDDIRSIINDSLSSFSYRGENASGFESGSRDSETSIFDCMRDTFKSGNYEKILSDLMDRDFETEDYIMWIDQNIPREIHEPEDLASAYDLVSRADLFLGRVLHKQHYAFKRHAEEIAAGVSFSIENRNSHFVKYDFPSTILKMSRLRDARESRKLLLTKLSRTCHTDIAKISEDMWFFSRLARNKKILSSMESRLSLSEKELAILRKG
jgi:replication factor C large subunit